MLSGYLVHGVGGDWVVIAESMGEAVRAVEKPSSVKLVSQAVLLSRVAVDMVANGSDSRRWRRIADDPPPHHVTVLLYRAGDLYPVVGSLWGKDPHGDEPDRELYLLWNGGPEDSEHAVSFLTVEAEPTHWRFLPETPGDPA